MTDKTISYVVTPLDLTRTFGSIDELSDYLLDTVAARFGRGYVPYEGMRMIAESVAYLDGEEWRIDEYLAPGTEDFDEILAASMRYMNRHH